MDNKKLADLAIKSLKKEYPNAKCSLEYKTPFELLIATRLAAQCTDSRVNIVTSVLFEKFSNIESFANADLTQLEKYISSCGLYKTKAKDIIKISQKIICDFNKQVPNNIDDLLSLPGVGRKTANLILGDIFGKPSIIVDTHCIRITKLLGFHKIKDPKKIEYILKECIKAKESTNFCHRLVLHGRAVCSARNPKCEICCMNKFCSHYITKYLV